MSWNYRVVEATAFDGTKTYAIHEVYYEEGVITSMTERPASIQWVDYDHEEYGGAWVLQKMQRALTEPVLTRSDVGEKK